MKQLLSRLWWLALLLLLSAGPTLAADVTFSLNLHYQIAQKQFTPGTDKVVVLGSFSTTGVALSDPDGDRIYTGTVTGQAADKQLTYNYRITRSGATVSETVTARRYVVQPTTAANGLTDWWNNQPPPYPYADFYVSSVKTIPGEIVRFFDSSEGGAATSWRWSIPNSSNPTSTAQNPTAYWSAPGDYVVSLTATGGGVSTTKTMTIKVVAADAQALGWNEAARP